MDSCTTSTKKSQTLSTLKLANILCRFTYARHSISKDDQTNLEKKSKGRINQPGDNNLPQTTSLHYFQIHFTLKQFQKGVGKRRDPLLFFLNWLSTSTSSERGREK